MPKAAVCKWKFDANEVRISFDEPNKTLSLNVLKANSIVIPVRISTEKWSGSFSLAKFLRGNASFNGNLQLPFAVSNGALIISLSTRTVIAFQLLTF